MSEGLVNLLIQYLTKKLSVTVITNSRDASASKNMLGDFFEPRNTNMWEKLWQKAANKFNVFFFQTAGRNWKAWQKYSYPSYISTSNDLNDDPASKFNLLSFSYLGIKLSDETKVSFIKVLPRSQIQTFLVNLRSSPTARKFNFCD